jgi:hypothetical protein
MIDTVTLWDSLLSRELLGIFERPCTVKAAVKPYDADASLGRMVGLATAALWTTAGRPLDPDLDLDLDLECDLALLLGERERERDHPRP